MAVLGSHNSYLGNKKGISMLERDTVGREEEMKEGARDKKHRQCRGTKKQPEDLPIILR